jgi:hypothetical protein
MFEKLQAPYFDIQLLSRYYQASEHILILRAFTISIIDYPMLPQTLQYSMELGKMYNIKNKKKTTQENSEYRTKGLV